MTDTGVGSLPSPVVNVGPGRRTVEGKKAAVKFREETLTESEDEPTPFKKVMAGKWGRSIEDTACTGSVEEPTQLQVVGPVSKEGEGQTLEHSDFDVKHVQPIAASVRPRPRPLKQEEPPAPAPTHVKAASKAASELTVTDALDANDEPLQYKLPNPNLSNPKSEMVKAKEALKRTQELMRKVQEEQKRARETVKMMKESV